MAPFKDLYEMSIMHGTNRKLKTMENGERPKKIVIKCSNTHRETN